MKSCLIVDDSRVIRAAARRIVEGLGFEAREAANGRDALEACKTEMPKAVLLDWNIPVMSGIDFLRDLRRLPGGDGPAVVFCTTENDVERIRQAIQLGADEYIMKPFDSEIVEAKFAQIGLI